MNRWIVILLLAALILFGCDSEQGESDMDETDTSALDIIPEVSIYVPETTVPSEPELLTLLIDPKDNDFVRVKDYIPNIITDLKYSTSDNFTGQVIYEFEDVFLRYGTVMKLKAVSEELSEYGLFLKIWDGFRPVSAQFKLWQICPDDTYVANPNIGYSNHSRGFAVDLTLVNSDGSELEMPTAFDDFSAKADRDYSECTTEQAENARFLERIMEQHGFTGYWGEWWHFNDTTKYDVDTSFDPGMICRQYTVETIALMDASLCPENSILDIPRGEAVTVLGYHEEYALVEYWGYRGYVYTEKLMK